MTMTTIWTLILSLALTTAAFAATHEENCQKKLSLSWGRYELCVEKSIGEYYGGGPFDKTIDRLQACVTKFIKTWPKLVRKYPGTSCSGDRYTDNGDGTFTDNLTRRVWEEKTDDGSVHDKGNSYTWSTGSPWKEDGAVFGTFLKGLNDASFGGARGWRMPTLAELNSLVDRGPPCGFRCTLVPGETALGVFYWTSSSIAFYPSSAWGINFSRGRLNGISKDIGRRVRAVRGGS